MLNLRKIFLGEMLALALALSACGPQAAALELATAAPTGVAFAGPTPTSLPLRPQYNPGELVDYIAHTGDTLPALAARFNTTVHEIRDANPQIPADATTMPHRMPMKIPIYYLPLWGTPFQILPDSLFVNGPSVIGFDTSAFVAKQPGWLKDYTQYAGGENRTGAQIVDYVAVNFSLSPRLLLALLEYEAGAFSKSAMPGGLYPLGYENYYYHDLYMQLVWAANMLNNGYYGWRTGRLTSFEHPDGRLERIDPWQTAATAALQYYFSRVHNETEYEAAIGTQGIARTYRALFGDPWAVDEPHIGTNLRQPVLLLPFPAGKTWAYTSGPHNGWGMEEGNPLAAVDFAPPAVVGGCQPTDQSAVAMADGVVARSETGIVVLDLDGDGDERTGWVIFYLHIATQGRAPKGAALEAGDPVGYPSCEGGEATGTHIHIARKYNGEWIPADGALAFNMEGWVVHNGEAVRDGTLTRNGLTVIACDCSIASSQLTAGK